MHFLFLAAQFEFITRFPTMILYFRVCTGFTAGPNIKWDVLHALQFCTGRYSMSFKFTEDRSQATACMGHSPRSQATLVRHRLF